jgi:hypothetical protein
VSREPQRHAPRSDDRLLRRRSSLPESMYVPCGGVPLPHLQRPAPPMHGPYTVWLRNPKKERIVIKSRRPFDFEL